MTATVLALGANLGDRLSALHDAANLLADTPALRVLAISGVYETAPVGGPDQDDYLNAVVLVDTQLSAHAVLERAHAIEATAGRVRAVRWGPRTLDVDVIAYGDTRSDDPRLTLPHPRAHERAFVLVPWHEIAPTAVLVGHGPIATLLAGMDTTGVRRRDDLTLERQP